MNQKSDIILEWINRHGMRDSLSATARAIYLDYPGVWNCVDSVRTLMRGTVLPKLPDYIHLPKGGRPKPLENIPVAAVPDDTNIAAISEDQLREMYDIRTIVMKALQGLKPGEYWREGDLIRRNFNGKPGFRTILDSRLAEPYRGKASGQVFFSHPTSIAKMKQEGVLL